MKIWKIGFKSLLKFEVLLLCNLSNMTEVFTMKQYDGLPSLVPLGGECLGN